MTPLHPMVKEVVDKQIRILRVVYFFFFGLNLLTLVGVFLLGDPYFEWSDTWWLHAILLVVAAILIGLVLPVARRRLMQPTRVMQANRDDLTKAGLPHEMDISIGRQAMYLSRYTAGCIITWGLCASVALYGMIVNLLGAPLLETALFFVLATLMMFLFPPRSDRLEETLLQFLESNIHSVASDSSAGFKS